MNPTCEPAAADRSSRRLAACLAASALLHAAALAVPSDGAPKPPPRSGASGAGARLLARIAPAETPAPVLAAETPSPVQAPTPSPRTESPSAGTTEPAAPERAPNPALPPVPGRGGDDRQGSGHGKGDAAQNPSADTGTGTARAAAASDRPEAPTETVGWIGPRLVSADVPVGHSLLAEVSEDAVVEIDLEIGADGRAVSATLRQVVGGPVPDEYLAILLDSFRSGRYSPATANGAPVPSKMAFAVDVEAPGKKKPPSVVDRFLFQDSKP